MKVQDIMTSGVAAIDADATIAQAAAQMKDRDVGLLPVLSEGRVIGVLTDRDIVIQAIATRMDPSTTQVRKIATIGPIWCRADDPLEDAARLMEEMKVRRLLVVDSESRPVGIVSLGDLATRLREKELAGEVLSFVASGP